MARIIKLQANNFKRLRAVEITPDPESGVVRICGRNGQGKSSVLDAIMAAVGGKAACPSDPIRHGEDRSDIRLELDDLVVVRRFTAINSYLEVTTPEGAAYKSPQAILDKLIGRLSFDPLAFSRMSGRDRRQALLSIANLDLDLDSHEARIKAAYEERRDVGRDVKQLEAEIQGMTPPAPDCPKEERSISEASARLQEELAKRRALEDRANEIDLARIHVQDARDLVAQRERELDEARDALTRSEQRLAAVSSKALPDHHVDEAQLALETIDEHNQQVRAARAYRSKVAQLEGRRQDYRGCEAALHALEDAKRDALGAADLPIPGLGLTDSEVTFGGVPYDQLATSEQIRIGLAMAMAANPKLRVIHIRDGSLLDSKTMATITEMVEAEGYQLWIECVDETGAAGVVIEDGLVAGATDARADLAAAE